MGMHHRGVLRLLWEDLRPGVVLLAVLMTQAGPMALAQGTLEQPPLGHGPEMSSPFGEVRLQGPVTRGDARYMQDPLGDPVSLEDLDRGPSPGPTLLESAPAPSPFQSSVGSYGVDAADEDWRGQWLPPGLIYRSYLAGMKEPRLAVMGTHDTDEGWLIDAALGARAAICRYGTTDPVRPEGWELSIEGAAFPRMSPHGEREMIATDFRVGMPLTFGVGRFQTKLALYHLSSHLGDEYMLSHPGFTRINYSRHAIVWGNSCFLTDDLRVYEEAEWAFYNDGGSEPWAFQFGIDYSPAKPMGHFRGAPFVAINAHLREEVDFGGNLVVQTGWQWRSRSGQLCRLGMQYFTGKSEQFEFYRRTEDRLGFGIWYDF